MENAIEIKGLTKNYRDFILNDISLDIPKGCVVGLIGENGAGKSTLIQSILGVIECQYDKLNYFGLDFGTYEKKIKEDIAVIFDNTHYNSEFTPYFIGKLLEEIYDNFDQDLYLQYLLQFDLPVKKKLKTFSRGMKMKLEFAIALSHHAKILILDEATSGLDPVVRDDILSMIRDFTQNEEHTVLISSHITSDLDKIADYIAYIHRGRLLFMKPYDVLHDEYGIVHLSKQQFDVIHKDQIISFIKEEYQYSVLIGNRYDFHKEFPNLEILRPSVEEIMLFYVKGVE